MSQDSHMKAVFYHVALASASTRMSFIWEQESTKGRSYDLEPDPYPQNQRAELGMLVQPQLLITFIPFPGQSS